MNTKYEFTGEEKEALGRILKRIRAIEDFNNIKAGDIGGWIEKGYSDTMAYLKEWETTEEEWGI